MTPSDANDVRAEARRQAGRLRSDRAEPDDQHPLAAQGVIGPAEYISCCAQLRSLWRRQASGRLRSSARVTAMVCSAMVTALVPRELVITMSLAIISGNSMLPTPAAGLWIQRRRRAAASCAAVICELNDDVDVGDGGKRGSRGVGADERVTGKLGAQPLDVRVGNTPRAKTLWMATRMFIAMRRQVPLRPPVFSRSRIVADHHPLVHRLHHVVDGQRRNRHRGQRLHLDAGRGRRPHARLDPIAAFRRLELDVGMRDRQRMAQRDQRRRLLRGHDAGQPRGLERIALLHRAGAHLPQRVGRHADAPSRDRFARRDALRR